jgi:hypothetical protein
MGSIPKRNVTIEKRSRAALGHGSRDSGKAADDMH